MGEFILCEDKTGKQPFFHDALGIHIYTMEELCYYMETNLFLLDKEWIGESLFRWIGEEMGESVLAERLYQAYGRERDVYSAVELIFKTSGIYSEQEYAELADLIRSMKGKTAMERRKMRADRLLAAGRFRRAAYTYMELLRPEFELQMTEELRGNILHNLGVAYARLFLFEEASEMFSRAWLQRRDTRSREAYLYTQNFLEDAAPMKEQEMELNFTVMREALANFTRASEDGEYFRERQAAAAAQEAFDWKGEQARLVQKWHREYEKMM